MNTMLVAPGGDTRTAPDAHPSPATRPAIRADEAAEQAKRADQARRLVEPVADRWESGSQFTEVETRITVDENTHEPVVRVLDARTDEVIREIPPEKIRKMAEFLDQWVGLRMDTRA